MNDRRWRISTSCWWRKWRNWKRKSPSCVKQTRNELFSFLFFSFVLWFVSLRLHSITRTRSFFLVPCFFFGLSIRKSRRFRILDSNSIHSTHQKIDNFFILANRRVVHRRHSFMIADRCVCAAVQKLGSDRKIPAIARPMQHSIVQSIAWSHVRPSASVSLIWSGCCLINSITKSVSPSAILPKMSSDVFSSSSSPLFHNTLFYVFYTTLIVLTFNPKLPPEAFDSDSAPSSFVLVCSHHWGANFVKKSTYFAFASLQSTNPSWHTLLIILRKISTSST